MTGRPNAAPNPDYPGNTHHIQGSTPDVGTSPSLGIEPQRWAFVVRALGPEGYSPPLSWLAVFHLFSVFLYIGFLVWQEGD